jgi:hypothetical protein
MGLLGWSPSGLRPDDRVLDADTRPAPGFVAQLAGNAEHLDGLVSVQSRHYVVRPYENLSAICNVVALMAGTATVYPGRAR